MSPYVIYSRKSQEDEDKQVQSIPDQEAEMKSVASRASLSVFKLLSESKSAKAPGRPVFDEMMKRVDRGELQGILCWKLDRLARNPVDGGRIIWAIKQHGLVVRTPHQTFSQADDNLILMYIEFGMAQKYVDDLSKNTLRGLKSKAQKGWFPGVAPTGYLNSKTEERGHKTIFNDPARFDAVRRMWDLMLTGNLSPARIHQMANEEWGFRTRQTKRTGGKPLSRSSLYKIFSNPFYYGRYEYPQGSGNWHQGQHEPMITEAEFKCVQRLMHRDTNPRPHKEFGLPFRGLIKCGNCRSSITAHVKEQVRCTKCRYKSSIRNREECGHCRLPVSKMKTPIVRHYVYYHCSRTLNPACREKHISAHALEKQVTEKIKPFGLPPELAQWGIQVIEQLRDRDLAGQQQFLAEKKRSYEQCVLRLENLVKLKTSPENADGRLLSDEEYQKERADLLALKGRLSSDASAFQNVVAAKAHLLKEALDLVGTIEDTAGNGEVQREKEILGALGSNHTLKEKELEIKPSFPFFELSGGVDFGPSDLPPIEPDNMQGAQGQNGHFIPTFLQMVPGVDEDRTKQLRQTLEALWKTIDPASPQFDRYPFVQGRPVVPARQRGKNGRYLPEKTQES